MSIRRPQAIALVVCLVAASIGSGAAQENPAATAEIAGTVMTTNVPPTALARVLVTISGQTLKPSRTIVSDDQGRFTFRNLPGGSFTIVAARLPFVKTALGAKRPGRPGTPINLAVGQRVTGVVIPLARGATITGMIRHTDGEGAPGVTVQATSLDTQIGSVDTAVTDDRGVFRIFGLAPGKYIVAAKVSELASTQLTQVSDLEMDEILARLQRRSAGIGGTSGQTVAAGAPNAGSIRPDVNNRPATYGYAPIYYPGTSDPDQSTVLALGEGEERGGVDIGLELVRTVAIEGHVSIDGGTLPPGTQVILTRPGVPGAGSSVVISPANSRQLDSSGNFRFTGVLPGKYRLMARATTMTPVRAPAQPVTAPASSNSPAAYTVTGVFWALVETTIANDDLSGLALMLRPGLRLSGRVAFEARVQTPPKDLATIRLRLIDVNGGSTMIPPGSGHADGTFEINGILPGTYDMTSPLADSGWWLRSVVVDGRDMLDFPLEIGAIGDVSAAVATFTDQHTELSGALQTVANIPAPDYFVVVFSADRRFWRPASRRVQFTRPGTDGRFVVRDLPAGDYLIAALTDMEPSDLIDVSFMEHLVSAALPVHLNDGEKKTQDLRLAR